MNTLTPRMCLELASHEALVRQAYYDGGGVLTWSIGITAASGHKVTRYLDNPQTVRRCLEIYIWLLRTKYLPQVVRVMGESLTEEQLTAAVSFHWNTGEIAEATWVKRWKDGDTEGARRAFMWYVKPASIRARRQAECDLFFDGTWSNDGTVPEYTRLTKSHTPVWSSRVEHDLTAEIADLLAEGV